MTAAAHALARRYFAALSASDVADDLLADDLVTWTTTSGANTDKARYQGAIRLLGTLFPDGITYDVELLIAEGDRVAAQIVSHGTLLTGAAYRQTVVFLLRIADGRIAEVAEHFDPGPIREHLVPLFQRASKL